MKSIDEQQDAGSAQPVRSTATRRSGQPARRRLISRLWQSAERQVAEVEARLKDAEGAALEQSAKTLAVLTRTVRDLIAIDIDMKPEPSGKSANDDNLPPARVYEEFRAELAGRLEGLLGERAGGSPSGPDEPGGT